MSTFQAAYEAIRDLVGNVEADRLLTAVEREAVAQAAPSRFTATPAEVHAFLTEHLAEDTYLRYQRAIGGRAASEAAKDVRTESNTPLASALYTNGMVFAADHIDPLKGGGPYPSSLIRFEETGGGRICRCDQPGADPYACEADDCTGSFSELNPFGGRSVNEVSAEVSRTCPTCGWRTSVWHVDDGSAEAELHGHVTRVHAEAATS